MPLKRSSGLRTRPSSTTAQAGEARGPEEYDIDIEALGDELGAEVVQFREEYEDGE